MAIKHFKNGSTLVTGDDIHKFFNFNKRDDYNEECSFCTHENNEDECDGCSLQDQDLSCSCHLNPPCSKCVGSMFEPSSFLLNYKHYQSPNGAKVKLKWECFAGNKETFTKLSAIETHQLYLAAETLNTGIIAIYICNMEDDIVVELCSKPEFKSRFIKTVMDFSIDNYLKTLE